MVKIEVNELLYQCKLKKALEYVFFILEWAARHYLVRLGPNTITFVYNIVVNKCSIDTTMWLHSMLNLIKTNMAKNS
jgi:hypothetical protein